MRVSEEPVHVELTVVGLDPTDKGRPVPDQTINVSGRAVGALLGLFDSQSAPGYYGLVSIQYEAGQDEAAISSLHIHFARVIPCRSAARNGRPAASPPGRR